MVRWLLFASLQFSRFAEQNDMHVVLDNRSHFGVRVAASVADPLFTGSVGSRFFDLPAHLAGVVNLYADHRDISNSSAHTPNSFSAGLSSPINTLPLGFASIRGKVSYGDLAFIEIKSHLTIPDGGVEVFELEFTADELATLFDSDNALRSETGEARPFPQTVYRKLSLAWQRRRPL
jgi:hypothetical protein